MLVFLLTLFVSAADVGAAHAASCVQQLPEGRADAPSLAADSSSHREDRAASRRALLPASLPAARFAFPPRLLACALYAPPSLGPRAQAATPSSQRDPPSLLA